MITRRERGWDRPPTPESPPPVPTCSHCLGPMRGSASVTLVDGTYRLCHPDVGLDCYRLVTLYQHPVSDCHHCTAGA